MDGGRRLRTALPLPAIPCPLPESSAAAAAARRKSRRQSINAVRRLWRRRLTPSPPRRDGSSGTDNSAATNEARNEPTKGRADGIAVEEEDGGGGGGGRDADGKLGGSVSAASSACAFKRRCVLERVTGGK